MAEDVFRGTERFELIERLGAGAFGVVYRAFDRRRGNEVALKTLQRAEPNSLYLFKREFRSLTDIRHPNLAEIYGLFSEDDRWFFTMELIEGVDFLTYVRGREADHAFQERPTGLDWDVWAKHKPELGPRAPAAASADDTLLEAHETQAESPSGRHRARVALDAPALARLRGALRGLTMGVNALHAAGMLHRDLKPANVMVTPEGRVVVLDFGLVQQLRPDASAPAQKPGLVGTPIYMSPEQAGEREVAEASDWYSVGVMLFEALTGEPPLRGSIKSVLDAKNEGDGPAPASQAADIPADLDRLCAALLKLDAAARPSGAAIAAALSAEESSTRRVRRRDGLDEVFVGRVRALLSLESSFEQARRGRAVLQLVRGESGMGKTALIERFLAGLSERQEATVLAGRCYQQESVPFKAWDMVVDALSRLLHGRSARELSRLIPRHLPDLLRLFPVLRRIEAFAVLDKAQSRADAKEVQRRSFEAFRDLLARLREIGPLVLFIDDLQWGDRDSEELLRQVLAPPDPPPLLLIAALRDDQGPAGKTLGGLTDELEEPTTLRDLRLGPLEDHEALDLARALLGPGSSRAEVIAQESEGKPFFLRELTFLGEAASGAVSLKDLVQQRVRKLSQSARRVLEAAAVAARPLQLPVLARMAELEAVDERALNDLRGGRLAALRSLGEEEGLEVADDRLRALVLQSLPEARQRDYHLRLARCLEELGGPPQQIADHYLAAAEARSAVRYVKLAAEQAEQALAFDRAALLYRRVIEVGGATGEAALPFLIKQAEALSDAERPWEAAPVYLEAAAVSPAEDALGLKHLAAHELLTSGRVAEGLKVLDEVLEAVGLELPSYAKRSDSLKILGRRLRYRFYAGSLGKTPRPMAALQADACQSVSMSMCLLNLRAVVDFLTRFNILAARLKDPQRMARGLAYEAWYQSVRGDEARSAAIRRRAEALIQRTDDPFLHALSYFCASVCAFFRGRWRAALVSGEEALQRFREHGKGVHWELALGRYYCQFSRVWLGRFQELEDILPAMLREARERGDLLMDYTLSTRILNDYLLVKDRPDQAESEVSAVCERWRKASGGLTGYTEFWEIYTELQRQLYRGQTEEALAGLRRNWSQMTPSFGMQLARSMGLSIKCRALIARAAVLGGERGQRLAREAVKAAAQLDRLGMPNARARALATRAAALSLQGDRPGAAAALLAAEEVFQGADMMLQAAGVRRCRGLALSGREGERLLADAEGALRACGAEKPVAVAAWVVPGAWRGEP